MESFKIIKKLVDRTEELHQLGLGSLKRGDLREAAQYKFAVEILLDILEEVMRKEDEI